MTANRTGVPADVTRPQIAFELARTVAACRSASAQCRGVRFRERDAVAAVADALVRRTAGPTPARGVPPELSDVVVAELAAAAATHVRDLAADARRSRDTDTAAACRDLDERIASGRFVAGLRARWDAVNDPGDLTDVIAGFVARGVDAERLTTAIVGHEAQRHVRLVFKKAHDMAGSFPDTTADELVGLGWFGLLAAMRKYDPALGLKFSTYAVPRIVGAIRDGVRAEGPLPKRLTTFARKVSATEEALQGELGRVPTAAELAERLSDSSESVSLLPRLAPAASIDEMVAIAGDRTSPSALIDAADPAERAVAEECRRAVVAAIESLPPEEAEVAWLYYEGLDRDATARAELGASARQLRARWSRASQSLAVALSDWQ